jgi:hypothetical protein
MFQDHSIIKASSPTFNKIVLLGCMIGYLTLPFGSMDDGNVSSLLTLSSCRVYPIMASTGFVLVFGSLLAKSYVYLNFNVN